MSNLEQFASSLANDLTQTEADIAIAVAWFLEETEHENQTTIDAVCNVIEGEGIRFNINRSRLAKRLQSRRDVSAPKGRPIKVLAAKRLELQEAYSSYLSNPAPEIRSTVLQIDEFEDARPYIKSLVLQIDGARQFELYDACAVMMRRLVEVLIIDAYEKHGLREKIVTNGQYQMLNGLIGALKSGQDYNISRNLPKWLDQLKELGDNAAHSRTYITKRIDIDDFAASYRKLVTELSNMIPKNQY